MAKLAEQAERYDEMVTYMKNVAKLGVELSVEERNLLSVAYKNVRLNPAEARVRQLTLDWQVIGARRASWRIISSIEQKEESKSNTPQVEKIKTYRNKVETELADVCNDILKVLDEHLIPSAVAGESKVFYHKMYVSTSLYITAQGSDSFEMLFFSIGKVIITDTSRSLHRGKPGNVSVVTQTCSKYMLRSDMPRSAASEAAHESYKQATEIAQTDLAPTHPIRLGLALNFSVFYYEILCVICITGPLVVRCQLT
ncbi:hypothetical protein EMMF5_001030 [Cystobasidiomycetes sp. EMM_F5]